MGFQTEFNWVLKLKKEQGLPDNFIVGETCEFFKSGSRVYPINAPIDLLNERWEAVAKVIILETKNDNINTVGKFKILKKYVGMEKEVITAYWRETIEMQFGQRIEDWSNVKVS